MQMLKRLSSGLLKTNHLYLNYQTYTNDLKVFRWTCQGKQCRPRSWSGSTLFAIPFASFGSITTLVNFRIITAFFSGRRIFPTFTVCDSPFLTSHSIALVSTDADIMNFPFPDQHKSEMSSKWPLKHLDKPSPLALAGSHIKQIEFVKSQDEQCLK